ncbi:hypothetical protein MKEN_00224100 [Mycena kentingensis (nom. inval.)]|nr:hypothetical protein MKEN_00224100 [Mycena kentingensis (nom. inval.)]
MSDSPRLPPDLERDIFELVGQTSSLKTVLPLLRVARRVHEWIEPFLYRSLNISNLPLSKGPRLDVLLELWRSGTKPPAFFTTAVRHLIILTPEHAQPEFDEIVAACSRVTHIAIGPNARASLPTILRSMPCVRRLAMDFAGATGFRPEAYSDTTSLQAAAAHLLPALTHLEIFTQLTNDPATVQRLLPFLRALPRLTHVAFNFDLVFAVVDALRGMPSLRVICWLASRDSVDTLEYARQLQAQPWQADEPRIVVLEYDRWYDGAEPFERTYWDRADDLVEQKRRGEIPATAVYAPGA